ncbi:MAG TPA: tetratricopeptide repeat protein [Gammaproteobacteria bacterium]|nr:tetratricopeptide repeat protein [Gammaproteobacteria bacterium]
MPKLSADQAFALALEHHRAGRLAEAERSYREILQREPEHADSLHMLGVIALQAGDLTSALALVGRAVALRPDAAVCRNNLGQVLQRLGRDDEAARCYEAAIELDPAYAEAHNNLGLVRARQDRPTDAEALFRKAIELDPRYAEPHTNCGNLLKDRGELDAAIACYRRAIELRPDLSALHSNLLLTLHYHADYSPADLEREHRAWAERHVAPLAATRRPHENDAKPDRRLRIGYVSPDLREHPVARFVLPLFRQHDRTQVEVFAYSDVTTPDAVTGLVRDHVDWWRDVATLGDEQLAEAIRGDGIDILVDLAAHSGGNRLLTFARKPAPVQITYLAYCSTTGVDAIDYRVTDRFLDPAGEASHYAEISLYLPHCYWCYSAPPLPGSARPVTERRPGPPIFGCLNNFAKVTDVTLDLWMRLLRRVPEARLLVYARTEAHRGRVRRAMREAGVEESRAAFVGRQPLAEYLETYRLIDVALDPHPYCGGTTTCDALWMGVPVVSLAGRTAVSRAGSTLLSHVGLERLVARSEEQYIEIAAASIRDARGLAALRLELRNRIETSPVMDAPQFARDLEAAFRTAWRAWCERRASA